MRGLESRSRLSRNYLCNEIVWVHVLLDIRQAGRIGAVAGCPESRKHGRGLQLAALCCRQGTGCEEEVCRKECICQENVEVCREEGWCRREEGHSQECRICRRGEEACGQEGCPDGPLQRRLQRRGRRQFESAASTVISAHLHGVGRSIDAAHCCDPFNRSQRILVRWHSRRQEFTIPAPSASSRPGSSLTRTAWTTSSGCDDPRVLCARTVTTPEGGVWAMADSCARPVAIERP